MRRNTLETLTTMAKRKDRLPVIIRGARQVGKTWLMKELGRTCFTNVAYVNFENSNRLKALFEGDFNIQRLITGLQIESGTKITPSETLLIFDEIQEVKRALTSLKYFRENAPEYAIVAAGSLLGVATNDGVSFPVGKVDFLDLHPMTFIEFLDATGNRELVELLTHRDWSLVSAFREKYIELLRYYFFVGGMPEVVSAFSQRADLVEVRQIQSRLLTSYEQDFSKHAPHEVVPRIRLLWDAVPSQLAKENKKFIFGAVRQGARAKDFEVALQWLADANMINKVYRVAKPAMPLAAYADTKAFKSYILDVGLLAAKSGLDSRSIIEGNRIFEEFKGSLTEQYVNQQLLADAQTKTYYWSAERGNAEVDFIIQNGMNAVPIEVKSVENLKAKSLKVYCEKYKPAVAVRTSLSDYREETWLTNVPLYAIAQLGAICSARSGGE